MAVLIPCGRCGGSGFDPNLGGGSVGVDAAGNNVSSVWRSSCGPCGGSGHRTVTASLASPVDAAALKLGRAAARYQDAEDAFNADIDRMAEGGTDSFTAAQRAAKLGPYRVMLRYEDEVNDAIDAYRAALRAADTTRGEERDG